MAKQKIPVKPLFALKHDFYETLDAVSHESIMLVQALEMLLKHGHVTGEPANIIRERLEAFRAVIMNPRE